MRQQIDNLNRQHAESLEAECAAIRSNFELLIEELNTKQQQEREQIKKGNHKHCTVLLLYASVTQTI